MGSVCQRAITTRRGSVHCGYAVGALGGTLRDVPGGIQLDVSLDAVERDCAVRPHVLLQCPGLNGAVDLTQVVDATCHLGRGACFHEVGNGDRSQQPDDCDHDHDLH